MFHSLGSKAIKRALHQAEWLGLERDVGAIWWSRSISTKERHPAKMGVRVTMGCCCCCCSPAHLSEKAHPIEEKQTVSWGMPQVLCAAYVMLCSNVCGCRTVGHDVSETMGVSAIVYADFVDGVLDSFSVSCQHSVMPAMKPAKVYSICTW